MPRFHCCASKLFSSCDFKEENYEWSHMERLSLRRWVDEARNEVTALWDYIVSFQFLFLLGGKMQAREMIPFIQAFQCICANWTKDDDFDSLISFLAKIFSDHLLYYTYGLHTLYSIYHSKPFICPIFSFPKNPSQSKCKSFSRVWLLCDSMDCSPPAPLSMGFSRQEYWSGLPFPSPGDLPDPEIKLWSPTLQADSLLPEPPGNSL